MTLDFEQFGNIFGMPTDKWWEKHWRMEGSATTYDNVLFTYFKIEFFAVQFRSRT